MLDTNNIIQLLSNITPKKSLILSTKFITNELANILYDISLNNNCTIELVTCGAVKNFNYKYSDIEALEVLLRISCNSILIKTNSEFSIQNFIIIDDNLLLNNTTQNTSNEEIYKFKETFFTFFNSSEDLASSYNHILDDYIINAMSLDNDLKDYVNNLYLDNPLYKNSYLYSVLQHDTELCSSTIPQYSNFNDGTYNVLTLLDNNSNTGYTYLELGKLLQGPGKKDGAYIKYGENHAKLSVILGLAYIEKKDKSKKVFISALGKKFNLLNEAQKSILLKYQIYNVPVIKYIFNLSVKNNVDIINFLKNITNLSPSTAKRRSSNIRDLFRRLRENAPKEVVYILDNAINGKVSVTETLKTTLQYSKEDIDLINNIITNKFTSSTECINIDFIFKCLKLRNNKFLKINNIDNTNTLINALQEIFLGKYYFEFPFVLQNHTTLKKYISKLINQESIINRNKLISVFVSMGCNEVITLKYVNRILNSLIRIDFDNYIDPQNIIFEDNIINVVQQIIDTYLNENNYLSLINNASILNKLPKIDYEWSMYLLVYVIQTYLDNNYNIICKYSSKTYKFAYLIIVKHDSTLTNIDDLIVNIINTVYGDVDSVSLQEIEDFLWTNDVISLRSCKSILSSNYFSIDELSRVSIKNSNNR